MTDPMMESEHGPPLPHCWGFGPEETGRILADLISGGEGATLYIKPHGVPAQIIAIVKPGPDVVIAFDGGGGTNNSHRCPPFTDCP
jgi:hypothetical protein